MLSQRQTIAQQIEREERKIHTYSIAMGRRQRQMIDGLKARDIRIALVEYALRIHPERASIAA